MSSTVLEGKSEYHKVIFLGERQTGKTSIMRRILEIPFDENNYSPTIGVKFENIEISLNEKHYYFQFWDTSGHSLYKDLIPSFLKSASVIVLVFDYHSEKSQDRVLELYNLTKDYGLNGKVLIVGNKFEKVKKEEPKRLNALKKEGIKIYPVSAKENKGIHLLLQNIMNKI
ncbi:MAG: Rab family GTPase [Candidatus Hodarchaeales archaeon]